MAKCPMQPMPPVFGECGKVVCEWWNERSERCSVFVIGDQIEDLVIAFKNELKEVSGSG